MKRRYQDNGLFSLTEVLERLGELRLKGSLRVEASPIVADVFVQDGKIVGAETNDKSGRDALDQIMALEMATVTLYEGVSPQKPALTIDIPSFVLEQEIIVDNTARLEPSRSTGTVRLNRTQTGKVSATERGGDIPDSKYYLDALAGQERIILKRTVSVVGREATSDITLGDASVSRRHCVIRLTNRGLHVTDLDSTNGTRVNGHLINDGFLSGGEILQVGDIELRVVEDEATAQAMASQARSEQAELDGGSLLNPKATAQIDVSKLPPAAPNTTPPDPVLPSSPPAPPADSNGNDSAAGALPDDMPPPHLDDEPRRGVPIARPVQEPVGSRTGAPQVPTGGNPIDDLQFRTEKH